MGGLLIGILLARTFAGLVGEHTNWRVVFWIACAMCLALAAVLARCLPPSPPVAGLRYSALMRSIWGLVRAHSELRQAALIGALLFAAFSAFWTTLVFPLATPPYHYGAGSAGLFGLVGAAGASAAPLAGRLADRRGPRFVIGFATALTLASFLLFQVLPWQLWGLVLGVVLLDLGVQSAGVSNLARIYRLAPGSESRVNTAYMVSYFAGGAAGSAAGAHTWRIAGWPGVCVLGIASTAAALAVHALGRDKTPGRVAPALRTPAPERE